MLGLGGDPAVLDVVFRLVVGGHQPAPIRQRQQERDDAEADHDRGQDESLWQRIGEARRVVADERRVAAVTARQHEHDVDAVADQADPDDDAAELAAEQQVGAACTQEPGDEDEQQGHGDPPGSGSRSVWLSSPSASKIMRINPTTIRYTPVSNTVADVSFTLPSSSTCHSTERWSSGSPPNASGARV